MLRVTVVHATPDTEFMIDLQLLHPATVADAVAASGIVERCQLAGQDFAWAIFGQRADPATPLRDGDRIELTRPLRIDAKSARRLRAAKRAQGR